MWRGSNRAGDDWHFHIQELKPNFESHLHIMNGVFFFLYFHLEFSFWMSEQFYSLRDRWCKLQHIARNKGALKMMEVGTWPRIRNFGCLRGYAWNESGPSSPNTWMNLVEVMSIFKTGNFLVANFVWVTWKPTTSLLLSHFEVCFFSKGWYYNILIIFLFTYEMYGSGLFPRRQPLYFFSRYGLQNVFGPVACGGRRHVHHIVWYVMIN